MQGQHEINAYLICMKPESVKRAQVWTTVVSGTSSVYNRGGGLGIKTPTRLFNEIGKQILR
jgi:hypothetical protein